MTPSWRIFTKKVERCSLVDLILIRRTGLTGSICKQKGRNSSPTRREFAANHSHSHSHNDATRPILVWGATLDTITAALAQLAKQRVHLVKRLRPHCGRLDPEDVLSEPILRLAERSCRGNLAPKSCRPRSPISKKDAIDFHRSPLSREDAVDPHGHGLSDLLIDEVDDRRR